MIIKNDLKQLLSENEEDQLQAYLEKFPSEEICNLEKLDGFFASLICCPEMLMPSEFIPKIHGNAYQFKNLDDANQFFNLIMRHWNNVANRFQSEDVFFPILFENESGELLANDWAIGFLKGVNLRPDIWAELMDDEENGGMTMVIFALAHENSSDPKLRPWKKTSDKPKRETLLVNLAASITGIYRYFEPHRKSLAQVEKQKTTIRYDEAKIGRNEPCFCGSGKKYKHCCLHVTRH